VGLVDKVKGMFVSLDDDYDEEDEQEFVMERASGSREEPSRRAVVLNLENATKELSRRLVDFLSGVAYANNGQIKRVANNAFLITPANVEIQGDLIDELENNGVYI